MLPDDFTALQVHFNGRLISFMCLSVATLSKLSENNEIFTILPGLVLALDFFRELPPLLLFPFFLPPFFITQPMTATKKTTC